MGLEIPELPEEIRRAVDASLREWRALQWDGVRHSADDGRDSIISDELLRHFATNAQLFSPEIYMEDADSGSLVGRFKVLLRRIAVPVLRPILSRQQNTNDAVAGAIASIRILEVRIRQLEDELEKVRKEDPL